MSENINDCLNDCLFGYCLESVFNYFRQTDDAACVGAFRLYSDCSLFKRKAIRFEDLKLKLNFVVRRIVTERIVVTDRTKCETMHRTGRGQGREYWAKEKRLEEDRRRRFWKGCSETNGCRLKEDGED
uniref:Apple domain-containing protein n=1 Tax=Syphacia muris TaxID=451379 RepID=A0A0N5AIG9_9BILA